MKSAAKWAGMIAGLAAAFAAGGWVAKRPAPEAAARPAFVSVEPAATAAENMAMPEEQDLPPGSVRVGAERRQLLGVRVDEVRRAAATDTVRLLGRVVPDEMRIYRVIAGTDGWIMRLASVTTGSVVRAGDLMATFYSFELMTGMQAYVNSVATLDQYGTGNRDASKQARYAAGNSQSYRNSLRNLGMSQRQLEELDKTRMAPDEIEIRATGPGFIVKRNVSHEQRFQKGDELYQIADLGKVWVLADLFGPEAQAVKPGLPAGVDLPDQGVTFQGRVSRVLPVFDAAARTLKLRIEVNNPDYVLRPDMFVDVSLPVTYPALLTVPEEALLDCGTRQSVFVDRGGGYFEPRQVETGRRVGSRIEIVRGLAEGERIAVSGTFLIDSESKMQLAAAGMPSEPAAAARTVDSAGAGAGAAAK